MPRIVIERSQPQAKALLDPSRYRHTVRQAEATCQGRRRSAPWELKQGQRVPVSLRDDPIADRLVEAAGEDSGQQRASVVHAQRADRQLGQARKVRKVRRRANPEHQDDRFRSEPPRDEPEDLE